MLLLSRTDSDNPDFRNLVRLLDQDLWKRDGKNQVELAELNCVVALPHAVVAYVHGAPVACGAFQPYSPDVVEIKRVFVQPAWRGQGIAQAILAELERWATESKYTGYVLETGRNQPEAIRLYEKSGYRRVANFGKYVGMENSVCMRKAGELPV